MTSGRILVTGGAGYVGSHYLLAERARGGHVVVIDSLVRGHREAVLDAELVVADVGDAAVLDGLFASGRFDTVVHFAAFAYVGESVSAPEKYYANNVASTVTLLDAMRRHGVRNIVFSSSCVTYGHPQRLPIDEGHPQVPVSPYGESKLFCEWMLRAEAHAHGLRYVALRYFNAAGADPLGRIGESHDPETHLIPLVLQVAAGKRPQLDVLGVDYDTPDGTCIRDYVHVSDLATAHLAAVDRLRQRGESGAFNLGTSHGHSVREVVASCERVTGRRVVTRDAPRRDGDPAKLVATASLAASELGWSPRHVELDDIVSTAWKWEQHRKW